MVRMDDDCSADSDGDRCKGPPTNYIKIPALRTLIVQNITSISNKW